MSNYLVLGGCGFIGRNVILNLINSDKAQQVIVADRSRPELVWLTGEHEKAFSNPLVVFRQCNLSMNSAVENLFSSYSIDYVINCASESRIGLESEVYKESILNVGCICATIAASNGVKRFIQVSTGAVYSTKKTPATEENNEDPSTLQAVAHNNLDIALSKIEGLNYIIVRPAIVYGIGDFYMLTPRLIIASVYSLLNEKMKLLYSRELSLNTVHVTDVARAIVFLCENGESGKKYILCDKSNTDQGILSDILSKIFNITYDFVNAAENLMVKTMLKRVAKDLNEKHLSPWSKACTNEGIHSSPLSPYIHKEALKHGDICLDGSRIESLGFSYDLPKLTEENIRVIIEDFVDNKMFPVEGYPKK